MRARHQEVLVPARNETHSAPSAFRDRYHGVVIDRVIASTRLGLTISGVVMLGKRGELREIRRGKRVYLRLDEVEALRRRRLQRLTRFGRPPRSILDELHKLQTEGL